MLPAISLFVGRGNMLVVFSYLIIVIECGLVRVETKLENAKRRGRENCELDSTTDDVQETIH